MEGMYQWITHVRLQLVGHYKLDPILCANCLSLSPAEPTYAFDDLTDHKAYGFNQSYHLLPCDFKVFLSRNLWLTGTIKVRERRVIPSQLGWARNLSGPSWPPITSSI